MNWQCYDYALMNVLNVHFLSFPSSYLLRNTRFQKNMALQNHLVYIPQCNFPKNPVRLLVDWLVNGWSVSWLDR